MAATDDFEQVLEPYHLALGDIIKGNPESYQKMFSHRDDVTLANPFGGVARGWEQVAETLERAASNFRDGEVTSFENMAKYVTPDLAYIVEVERYKAKVGKREDVTPVALRVTSIFRREDGVWKVAHRHADPVTSVRPAESLIQK